ATEVPGVFLEAPSPTSGIQGSHPVPDAVSLTKAEARLRAPRAPDGEPREFGPAGEPIRLGDTGYFRDQKFIEVIYTPAVAPPGGGQALFYGEVDVDLVVEGIAPGAVAEAPSGAEAGFEDQYRAAFANYAEGRYFRLRHGEVTPTGAARAPSLPM